MFLRKCIYYFEHKLCTIYAEQDLEMDPSLVMESTVIFSCLISWSKDKVCLCTYVCKQRKRIAMWRQSNHPSSLFALLPTHANMVWHVHAYGQKVACVLPVCVYHVYAWKYLRIYQSNHVQLLVDNQNNIMFCNMQLIPNEYKYIGFMQKCKVV